jgi:hypothetical protein
MAFIDYHSVKLGYGPLRLEKVLKPLQYSGFRRYEHDRHVP